MANDVASTTPSRAGNVVNTSSVSVSSISGTFGSSDGTPASQSNVEQDANVAAASSSPQLWQNNLPESPPARSHVEPSIALGDGYDSDDGVNHNAAVQVEGPQELSEETLPEASDDVVAASVPDNETEQEQPSFVMIEDDVMKKMRVSDLKNELTKRGLSNKGLKNALLDRLKQAMVDRVPCMTEQQRTRQEQNETVSGFAAPARWRLLTPLEEAVVEPTNVAPSMRAPTVPEEDVGFIPQKHDYAEKFDRDPFAGVKKVPRTHRNRHQMRDPSTNQPMWNEEPCLQGGPRAEWIASHGLNSWSHPADWFNAFLPINDGTVPHPYHLNTPFWTNRWANYLNMKASQMGAGIRSGLYPDFEPFSNEDIERHIGLYILQGLNPSPQIEYKFCSQASDPVQGNDLCFRVFGAGAVRKHKHFKAFFCVQDPTRHAPPRKERPTYKVDPVLRHVQEVSMKAWRLGRDISGDEQTIGFQGRHADKQRITYKAEGDGFQCDAICDSGFTWTFYFRNQPAPAKYLREGYSPLHSRVLGLFDQLEFKYHNCWFDNLYLSAKFCKAAFTHPKAVRISGPTRKSGRGLPKCVMQEELTNPADLRRVRGTVKAAVLDGDDTIPNLVAVSYYDQKPVHFLSTICESIKWVECQKRIFCVETEQVEVVKFLRLNINNDYNNDMGNVDIADQLRNYYRFDHWMRKRKWWWSVFFWAIGILLVNSYLCYKHYTISTGRTPMSHYEFRKAIALAWLDSKTYWPNRMKNKKKRRSNKQTASENEEWKEEEQDSDGEEVSSLQGGRRTRQRANNDGETTTRTTTTTTTRTTKVTTTTKNTSERSIASAATEKKKRAPPVTDVTLDCRTGALRVRLESCCGAHMPEQTGYGIKCALHNWALGK